MQGWDLLHPTDHTQMVVMQAVIQRTIRLIEEHDEALAVRIANAVARSLGGK